MNKYFYEKRYGFEPVMDSFYDQEPVILSTKKKGEENTCVFPLSLSLCFEMVAQKVPLTMQVEMILDQSSCGQQRLLEMPSFRHQGYDRLAGHQKIDFLYQGQGQYCCIDGSEKLINKHETESFRVNFHSKTPFSVQFPTPYQGIAILVAQLLGNGVFQNLREHLPNHLTFYSVGGTFAADLDLEKMVPVFVSPFIRENQTEVFTRDLTEILATAGCRPPHVLKIDDRYTVNFHDPLPSSYYRSVAEVLRHGDFKLTLQSHTGQKLEYRSVDFKKTQPGQVEILFQP